MADLIETLLTARETGKAVADADLELPISLSQAYEVQDAYVKRLLERSGGQHLGYKLGATNDAILAAMGLERPFSGPILSEWVHHGATELPRSGFFLCVIEAEIGFRLGRDLPDDADRLSITDITDAIAEAFPVIEIADSRLQNWQKPDARAIVSDLGAAGAVIFGKSLPGWRSIDLSAMPVKLSANGIEVAAGTGAMALGNPVACLLAFARERAAMGRPLKKGEIVSSGTCTPPYPGKAGQHLVADFGPFGTLALTLA